MSLDIKDENVKLLVSELLDGELSEEQKQQLLDVLKSDGQITRRVIELFLDNCVLEVYLSLQNPELFIKKVLLNAGYLDTGNAFTNRVETEALKRDILSTSGEIDKRQIEKIRQYARDQLQAFLEEQRESQRLHTRIRRPYNINGYVRQVSAFLRFARKAAITASVSFCIFLAVFLSVHHYLANRVVATLERTLDAKWDREPENTDLRAGPMRLQEGYATIKFAKGSEVIVQAPSSFELKSTNKMFLETGWVTAKVPAQAKGFEIQTSSSSVVDYGTEFGLMVGNENLSELHVFQGRISLTSDDNKDSSKIQQIFLEQGQAATIDTNGDISRSFVANRPRLFIREMPESEALIIPGKILSLADMIGGGNGLGTGTLNQGLDPSTGQITMVRKNPGSGKGFKPEPILLFIDGVFVPDSRLGPCIVSSTGTEFADCPTTNGSSFETIANSAMFLLEGLTEYHPGRINGRIYNTAGQPSISMHPNSGITFDLDKIRSFMPDIDVIRFRALCGISDTLMDYIDAKTNPRLVDMDFWVLVDGRTVFTKRLAAAPPQSASIDIPLGPADHFLTLAATSPVDISMRWGMFAEPILELSKTNITK
jgi:hypothetical protein